MNKNREIFEHQTTTEDLRFPDVGLGKETSYPVRSEYGKWMDTIMKGTRIIPISGAGRRFA